MINSFLDQFNEAWAMVFKDLARWFPLVLTISVPLGVIGGICSFMKNLRKEIYGNSDDLDK